LEKGKNQQNLDMTPEKKNRQARKTRNNKNVTEHT